MNLKILLLNASYTNSHYDKSSPPAGIGYIAETLLANGFDCRVLDLGLGYTTKDLIKTVAEYKPDIVGMSAMTYRYKTTYSHLNKIKKNFPNVKIIIGGAHISTCRESVLNECPSIDYGVVCEGEETIIEICNGKPIEEVKGVIYRIKNEELRTKNEKMDNNSTFYILHSKIIYTGDRPFISDLDSIPFPRYEKFELNKYLQWRSIVSSRGCPYQCIFCPVKSAIGNKLRIRSAESVVDEIVYWYNKGIRNFDFADDNFTFYKDRVLQICDKIKSKDFKDVSFRCANGIRADRIDRETLQIMRETGFNYIAFGVEAGNNKILKNIKKGETIEVIESAIRNACELGYEVTLFFLIGSPGETMEDIKDSISLATKYPVKDFRFYNLIPFPNTELFDFAKEKNFFIKDPADYLNSASAWGNNPVFKTNELSLKERKEIIKQTRKLRNNWHKNWLEKDFKNRYNKFGLLGKIMVLIYVNDFTRKYYELLRNNKFLRKIIFFVMGRKLFK